MQNRRSFIGSIIGSFLGYSFIAQLPNQIWQFEEQRIYPYRLLIRTTKGVIQGTPIIDMPKKNIFIAGDFIVKQTMITTGAILLDEKNRVIGEQRFNWDACAVNGDTLKITYTQGIPR